MSREHHSVTVYRQARKGEEKKAHEDQEIFIDKIHAIKLGCVHGSIIKITGTGCDQKCYFHRRFFDD